MNENLSKYLNAIYLLEELKIKGIINASDYEKSEKFFAKKYCIKIGNLYRQNGLIKSDFRVMYMMPKEEVQKDGNDSKANKRITEIR